MKKVIIFGGSGFIGKHLIEELKDNYSIIIISRKPRTVAENFGESIKVARLRRRDLTKISDYFEGAEAVINLAGENIGGYWNKKKMEKIRKSRLDVDNIIVRAFRATNDKPKVIIQGSAAGIYGFSRNTIDVTEETQLGQRGFLPKVAIGHEETFHQLEKLTRVVYIRTGLVLDAKEGALPKLALPFNLFIGGKLGSGKQWNSWIHIDDEVRAIKYLLENKSSQDAYNLVAPNPVKQEQLAAQIGQSLKRPNYLAKPAFILRLLLGVMADEVLLNGVKVIPNRLVNEGFKFNFETIESALSDIYKKSQ